MVQLYAAEVTSLAPRFSELTSLLEKDRQAFARRVGPNMAGLRSLGAGLLARTVLGAHWGAEGLQKDSLGKPYLPGGPLFSLSHAGDYALLGVSDLPVGVDIERCRDVDFFRLSARFYHPLETAFVHEAKDIREAFFTIWTLKESYLKAEGVGFSVASASVCILPEAGTGNARVCNPKDSHYFARLYPGFPGYCVAACARENAFADTVQLVTL